MEYIEKNLKRKFDFDLNQELGISLSSNYLKKPDKTGGGGGCCCCCCCCMNSSSSS
ncbi:hypothetical protein ACIP9G_05955 [Lysinibacillus sp. NPDC093197]|uniref:hypothetical protein n=1 Tax=Lysinibacillus sp. NPDC093197 TaxID=3364132 RepID=UPI00381576DA